MCRYHSNRFVQAGGIETLLSLLGCVITSVASRRHASEARKARNGGLRRTRTQVEWSFRERRELLVEQTVVLKTLQALLNLSAVRSLQVRSAYHVRRRACRAGTAQDA